jgi:hypothetical protein
VAADLLLPFEDDDVVPASGGYACVLEPGRPGPDHECLLARVSGGQRSRPPPALAPDFRVVHALDATAADHASPAVVGGNAAPDVLRTTFARLLCPLSVREQLAGEQDRVGLVGREDLLGDLRVRDAADEQNRLRRDLLDLFRTLRPAGRSSSMTVPSR